MCSVSTNTLIVGAGFSGLGMGIKLKELGVDDFVILEKAPEVGGTWWWNKYPGCACDIPSHLYSYSFYPKSNWSRVYPSQPELLEYMKDVAVHYKLYPHIRFNRRVTSADWEEAASQWTVTTDDGSVFTANYLVLGGGALHVPVYPTGSENFKGDLVHTSNWNPDFALQDKRVAFVGSGASAVQAVPEVAKVAKEVYVFQRTPSWVAPKQDYAYPGWFRFCLRWVPFLRRSLRFLIYWRQELLFLSLFTPKTAEFRPRIEGQLTEYIGTQLEDKNLLEKVTPNYLLGCKRILISNDYYPTFNKPNVQLIPHAVDTFQHNAVTSQGKTIEVDAIVCATGFNISSGFDYVNGRNGVNMERVWDGLPTAHLGMTVPDFPNCFFLLGPGTGLGHNSVVWMIEVQLNYIQKIMSYMKKRKLKVCAVKREVYQNSTSAMLKNLEKKVWKIGGCRSWYQNKEGRVYAVWDGPTIAYWWKARTPVWSDFMFS